MKEEEEEKNLEELREVLTASGFKKISWLEARTESIATHQLYFDMVNSLTIPECRLIDVYKHPLSLFHIIVDGNPCKSRITLLPFDGGNVHEISSEGIVVKPNSDWRSHDGSFSWEKHVKNCKGSSTSSLGKVVGSNLSPAMASLVAVLVDHEKWNERRAINRKTVMASVTGQIINKNNVEKVDGI